MIVVLANRQPFQHDYSPDGDIVVRHSTSGLVTAIEPLVRACSGVWVAHGTGTADRVVVDRRDGLDVPPANPAYRLRRVWLDERERRGYYQGFANEALWPLCHRANVRPVFRKDDFATYRDVNAKFAEAACTEIRAEASLPILLVQDYHFALAPRMIRDRLPVSAILSFWHIPWPERRDFEACPWARDLLVGMLGSSVVGFQTETDCRNFIDTVEHLLNAPVDRELNAIWHHGRQTIVRSRPVSVEWPNQWARELPPADMCRKEVNLQLGLASHARLGVGVDRIDYTKGLVEKFLAVERMLERSPELRERFVFAQLAQPTRDALPAYRALQTRVRETAERVNRRFGTSTYRPIVLLEGDHDPVVVHRFLRAADVCYVGSLHDGMNLVAKEFVTAREDERGVLVLSRFAGAARELAGALIVDPNAIDDAARALRDAVGMPLEEQSRRMRDMRAVVARFSTHWWASRMLDDARRAAAEARLRRPPSVPPGLGGQLYSDRSAWMTSMRDARAAGISDAKIAAATRIVAAPATGTAPGKRMPGR
jgi:trehalose 6-phosphate synthase